MSGNKTNRNLEEEEQNLSSKKREIRKKYINMKI